jgi:hypothetical protein
MVSAVVDDDAVSDVTVEREVVVPVEDVVEEEVAAAAHPERARLETRSAEVSQGTGEHFARRGRGLSRESVWFVIRTTVGGSSFLGPCFSYAYSMRPLIDRAGSPAAQGSTGRDSQRRRLRWNR